VGELANRRCWVNTSLLNSTKPARGVADFVALRRLWLEDGVRAQEFPSHREIFFGCGPILPGKIFPIFPYSGEYRSSSNPYPVSNEGSDLKPIGTEEPRRCENKPFPGVASISMRRRRCTTK
jgi:hypothetical protein